MNMEKKTIAKADGRYLVYYHFAETATPEQTEAYRTAADEPQPETQSPTPEPQNPA